jgi:hypothetical protein
VPDARRAATLKGAKAEVELAEREVGAIWMRIPFAYHAALTTPEELLDRKGG